MASFRAAGLPPTSSAAPGYVDPRQGFETCSWVEFMHSFEMLTKISGNPVWADRCEEIAFNWLPAAMTPDLKGLHYFAGANIVQLDRRNKSPDFDDPGGLLPYSPYGFGCCQHNVSHGWPYYAEELWLATADKGLCASLYAASEVTAKVGDGSAVTVAETTDYPFGDTVELKLAMAKARSFSALFADSALVPGAAIRVNGRDWRRPPRRFRTCGSSESGVRGTWSRFDSP